MMARLSALALNNDIESDLARELVLLHDLEAPPEAGNSWPWAVRIQAFGQLRIERSDGPMPVSRKSSKRLLELLALLAAQGRSLVSQEQIADQLWPDAEGDAARNALDNALHRLRKFLGGDDRILLRQGALSLNSNYCWSDVAELEAVLGRLGTACVDQIAPLMKLAIDLYRQPLLPDNEIAGVITRRTLLDKQLRRTLLAANQRLIAAGRPQVSIESLPDL